MDTAALGIPNDIVAGGFYFFSIGASGSIGFVYYWENVLTAAGFARSLYINENVMVPSVNRENGRGITVR